MRTPLAVIGVLLAVLVPIGFVTDGGDAQPAAEPSAPVAEIARRVEGIRALRFDRLPRPLRVTAEQAQREGLADLDRGYPVAQRRGDEALYTLLGLLPAGTDLRDVTASVFGEEVAGYYDPRDGRLRIVEGPGTANRVLDEMVLAHELNHALEDQAIGLRTRLAEASGDAALAYKALVEGTASEVMYDYVERHFTADVALGGLLGSAFAGTGDLPPFMLESLLFPYQDGQRFVAHLLRRAGHRWTLVDLAHRIRPPASTEQILHPEKWLRVEQPDRVSLRGLGRRLGAAYGRVTAGTFGEWQTGRLLAPGGGDWRAAAAGWGGDRYEVWRRDAARPCPTPCRSRDVLVMRWRWDTAGDARGFSAALRRTLPELLDARPSGADRWVVDGSTAELWEGAREATLVLAPDAATAARAAGGRQPAD